MSHVHTDPGQHDMTASAFIIRIDTPEPTIMLHMHQRLNKYMHFGGHVELHENPWQALVHEIQEESGYDIYNLHILQPELRITQLTGAVVHPVPAYTLTVEYQQGADHYHTDLCYALVANGPPTNPPAEGESQDFILLTRDQIQQLPQGKIIENLRESALFTLDNFLTKWHQVPTTTFKEDQAS